MDSASRTELNNIRTELNSIIRELENISYGVRRDFKGIGNETCANCIDRHIRSLYSAKHSLDNLDTNALMDWFKEKLGLDG